MASRLRESWRRRVQMAWWNAPGRCAPIRRRLFTREKEALRTQQTSRARSLRNLLAKLDLRRALSTLILRWLGGGRDVGMTAQVFAKCATEDAHSGAVHNADAREAGEEGAGEKSRYLGLGRVGAAAD